MINAKIIVSQDKPLMFYRFIFLLWFPYKTWCQNPKTIFIFCSKLFVERVCRSSLTNSDHKVLVQLSFFDKLGLQPKCHKNKYIDTKKVWNLKCVNMLLNVHLHLYHALLRTSLNWFAVFSMIDNRLPDEQVIE